MPTPDEYVSVACNKIYARGHTSEQYFWLPICKLAYKIPSVISAFGKCQIFD